MEPVQKFGKIRGYTGKNKPRPGESFREYRARIARSTRKNGNRASLHNNTVNLKADIEEEKAKIEKEKADKLAADGVACTVVNARFIKPSDSELLLNIAGRIKRIVTVEENALSGGFGSTVATLLENSKSDARIECIGIPDEFVAHGPQKVLRAKYNLDADGIAQRVVSAFPELAARAPMKPNR